MRLHHFKHNHKLTKLNPETTLLKSVLIGMTLSLLTFLATYFYTTILTNLLGVNSYGIYATITSTVFTIYLVLLIGVDQGLIAFIPDMIEKNDFKSVGTYFSYSKKRTIIQFSLIFLISIVFIVGMHFFNIIPENSFTTLVSYLWICPIGACFWFIGCYVQARNYANTSIIILDLLPAVLLLVVLLLFTWVHLKLSLFAAIILSVFTTIIATLICFIFCKNKQILPANFNYPKQNIRQWNQTNFDLYIITLITYTPCTLIIIFAQFFSPSQETAAVVSVLCTISAVVFVVFTAISAVYTPQISAAVEDLNITKIRSLLMQSTIATIIAGAIPTLVVIIGGKYWLSQFGKEYVGAYLPLVLITIANYLNIVLSPFQFVTQYSRDLRIITCVALAFFIVFIVISIFGDRYFGVMGAVLAYCFLFIFFWVYLGFVVVFNWNKLFAKTAS